MSKIYFFIGTNAELIKLSPVIRELKKRRADFKIISSNQNTLRFDELSCILGRQSVDYIFKMKPFKWPKNIYLRFAIWVTKSLGNYLIYFLNEFKGNKRKGVIFIVHGDTITALIGALIAKICSVKLAHIESGLRSYNFLEPFPEEISRFIIALFADIHFCPNNWSMKNLKHIGGLHVNTFYNTVGESINLALRQKANIQRFKNIGKYFILILHRQEHTLFNKGRTENIIKFMRKHVKNNFKCVFVMHPLTKNYLIKQGIYSGIKRDVNIILPDRLPYTKFVTLLSGSEFIATDGGSNQEEAFFLGKPCLILRKSTERIEGLGENATLSGDSTDKIQIFMNNYSNYRRPVVKQVHKPSEIIVNFLMNYSK